MSSTTRVCRTDREWIQIAKEYDTGASILELARRHQISRTTIYDNFERLQIRLRPTQGRRVHLTDEQWEEIAAEYVAGATYAELAEKHSVVSRSTIASHLRQLGVESRPPARRVVEEPAPAQTERPRFPHGFHWELHGNVQVAVANNPPRIRKVTPEQGHYAYRTAAQLRKQGAPVPPETERLAAAWDAWRKRKTAAEAADRTARRRQAADELASQIAAAIAAGSTWDHVQGCWCGARATQGCLTKNGKRRGADHGDRVIPKCCPCGARPEAGASYCRPCRDQRRRLAENRQRAKTRKDVAA